MILPDLTEPPYGDLDAIVAQKRAEFASAQPFPHCVLDGFLSDALLERIVEEIDQAQEQDWKVLERDKVSHFKRTMDARSRLGPYTRHLVTALSTPPFLNFVEEVTGIRGLICDPYMHGGGIHQIGSGGYLELHSDFNWHGHIRMYRRLNLLLYLNRDWKEEYNGALELWDRRLEQGARHYPLWNRMVIQIVTADAMHGFPEPIRCPEGMTRKSLAMWYYTTQLPIDVQLGYDLCEPNFIRRTDRPIPLPRPLWRRLLPPVVTAFVKKHRQTKSFSPLEVKTAMTRFLPPLLVEGYERLRGRKI